MNFYKLNRVRTRIVSALFLCSVLGPATSVAQDETIEEVVVVGFSRSLEAAIDGKRNADQIIDSVVAEDIGKFPAVNISEALQRVPGVSIHRDRGEGLEVSVRGLGPNFQFTTLNGVPIAYNENIRDSGQGGRIFRFRVLAADLIERVNVIKSPTADNLDGGIGSTIDIRTRNPLDAGTFASGRAFANFEEQAEDWNPNGNISAGWVNDDETFGVLGGFAVANRALQFERFLIRGWGAASNDPTFSGPVEATLEVEDRQRSTLFGAAQWRPSDTVELQVDIMRSEYERDILEDRIRFERSGGVSAPGATVVENGFVVADTIIGGRINNNLEASLQNHVNQFVKASGVFSIAGDWEVRPAISYSSADSDLDLPLQRIDARTNGGVDGLGNTVEYSFDLRGAVAKQGIPTFSTNIDVANPDAIPFRRFRVRPINSEDEDTTFLLDLDGPIEFNIAGLSFDELRFGGQFTDRSRNYQRRDRTLELIDRSATVDGSFYGRLTPSAYGDIFGSGSISQWTAADPNAFLSAFQLPASAPLNPPNQGDLGNSYGVDEEIVAAYVRSDFNSAIGGVDLTGNVGIRFVSTDQMIVGSELIAVEDSAGGFNTERVPATFGGSYDAWLPSINAAFDLSESTKFRLSVARTLTRPSLADLRSALTPNSSAVSELAEFGEAAIPSLAANFDLVANAGNPNLRPYTAWNLDASFEWYFDDFGAITIAGFWKGIDDFILRTISPQLLTVSGVTTTFEVSSPQNIGKVSITGLELGYTNRWELGSGFLGLASTFAAVEATRRTNLRNGGVARASLNEVPKISYSIAPFVEYGDFTARLGYTWTDEREGGLNANPGSLDNNAPEFNSIHGDFGILDLSADYTLTENAKVFVEISNITDEVATGYPGTDRLVLELNDFGRNFNVGVSVRF